MKKKYKFIIICLGIILFIAFGLYGGFLGGSYSYAQQYEFDATDSMLVKAVENFKMNNSNFKIPKSINLNDSKKDYKYHFYLYCKNKNKLIHCFIMSADESHNSSIYLDAINDGLTFGNWKVVNRDYGRNENLKVKKEFRENILDKLKLTYKDKGNGMFIFWK